MTPAVRIRKKDFIIIIEFYSKIGKSKHLESAMEFNLEIG